jgi:methylenetetrahydrofolate dehydrogenase (NADP+)/methenyltetrahydrofolate cyclohydrolase
LFDVHFRADATVTVAHSKTRDLPDVVRHADIVVSAMGQAEIVRGSWLKPGCTVIDVGFNETLTSDGQRRVCGDVLFDEAIQVASHVTPVPGGVGPMTIAMLMKNTVTLAAAAAAATP